MAKTAAKTTEKPLFELISISEIAKRLKLDRATVRSRLDDLGYEADPSSTQKNQLFAYDAEMEFALKAAKDTVSAMKIREMRARAEKLEMQNAITRGELVPMAEAIEIAQKLVSSMYQELTVRQPKRIAPKLAKAKTVAAVKKVMKSDIDRIMKSLKENFKVFADLK